MSNYLPKPEDKFTFGLWTVGNRGADPCGTQGREQLSLVQFVELLIVSTHKDLLEIISFARN